MVVRLRLARFGRKHAPTYRIVAADARCPRDGKHIEQVGSYDPKPRKDGTKEIRLKADRIKYWLSVGAQPSQRVERILGMAALLPPPPMRPNVTRQIPKSIRREFHTAPAFPSGGAAAGGLPGATARPFVPTPFMLPESILKRWR